jgi:DNA-binding NtrC family response regulator
MTTASVLWICKELPPYVESLFDRSETFDLTTVTDLAVLPEYLNRPDRPIVVIDLPLEPSEALALLPQIRSLNEAIPVIFHNRAGVSADCSRLIDLGAFCVLTGEPDANTLTRVLEAAMHCGDSLELIDTADKVEQPPWRRILIGQSAAMQHVVDVIELCAPRQSTVLITGETGTGKEVVARAIHMASNRCAKPLVAVNCGAIPENLIEAELFGHTKGAFTGAIASRIGRFEQAKGGTLFLDEIGDLPLQTQGKLLRVLQEREFERVGGNETIQADTRVIAATNVNLAEAVSRKAFREDLYYRLNVVPLRLPPLRQRTGDIPLLARYFTEKIRCKEHLGPKVVTYEAMHQLESFNWPGNVRQLEHAIENAIVLSGDRTALEAGDFDLYAHQQTRMEPLFQFPQEGLDFDGLMSQLQRYLLQQALLRAGGNKSRAAEMLGMKRSTLVSKVKALT